MVVVPSLALASTTELAWFGAKGDGTTDDTAAFRSALAGSSGSTLHIARPAVKYLVGPLSIPSNATIQIDSGTIIQAKSGFTTDQNLISLSDVSNVSIVGSGAIFQMPKAEYTSGEHRHCMAVRGGSNIHLEGFACNSSGGDGFYIGMGSTSPNQVALVSVSADNNRRQGLSIISGSNVTVTNSTFTKTNGTDPQCGIDIEPNDPTDVLKNITLSGVQTGGNAGCGMSFSLFALDSTSQPVSINVTKYADTSSAGYGIQAQCNWTTGGGGVSGAVTVNGATIESPASFGAYLKDWERSCASLTLTDVAIHNARGGDGVYILARSGVLEAIGNMHFVRPVITDTNSPSTLKDYFLISDSSKGYTNITIQDPTMSGARDLFAYPSLLVQGSSSPSPVPAPSVPANVFPLDGATATTPTPTLVWGSATGATSYSIYGGTSPSAMPLVKTVTAVSYSPGKLNSATKYYWRVTANNSSGSTSSPTWTFTVK